MVSLWLVDSWTVFYQPLHQCRILEKESVESLALASLESCHPVWTDISTKGTAKASVKPACPENAHWCSKDLLGLHLAVVDADWHQCRIQPELRVKIKTLKSMIRDAWFMDILYRFYTDVWTGGPVFLTLLIQWCWLFNQLLLFKGKSWGGIPIHSTKPCTLETFLHVHKIPCSFPPQCWSFLVWLNRKDHTWIDILLAMIH